MLSKTLNAFKPGFFSYLFKLLNVCLLHNCLLNSASLRLARFSVIPMVSILNLKFMPKMPSYITVHVFGEGRLHPQALTIIAVQ